MDITHYYIEQGNGFPLILLHGNGEDSSYFVHQMESFAQHFHVIAIDTRGHGQTPRGDAPFTIRQFAEDLLEFMDQHDIKKAHILGFSDGGNIAMVFALMHPERVCKLVLNGANLNASGVKRRGQIPIEIGYLLLLCINNSKEENLVCEKENSIQAFQNWLQTASSKDKQKMLVTALVKYNPEIDDEGVDILFVQDFRFQDRMRRIYNALTQDERKEIYPDTEILLDYIQNSIEENPYLTPINRKRDGMNAYFQHTFAEGDLFDDMTYDQIMVPYK